MNQVIFTDDTGKNYEIFLEEGDRSTKETMKQLTFDGMNDLFQHPRWGAITLEHAKYLDGLRVKPGPVYPKIIPISDELARREERCIDEHGCSSFIH